MSDSYDEEAVYQEADFLQAEYEREDRIAAARRREGICLHSSAVGYRDPAVYPEQVGLRPGELRCTEGCGTVFASDDAWSEAREEAIYG